MANADVPYHKAMGVPSTQTVESVGRKRQATVLRVVDVVCVFLVSFPFVALELNIIRPFRQGFSCDDHSIKYPNLKDTIPDELLSAGGLLMAIFIVCSGEVLCVRFAKHHKKTMLKETLYRVLGSYLFGAAATLSLTAVAKATVGRLRPHFLDVCKPFNCSEEYSMDHECTGQVRDVNEARKSFFSGHASFAMYTMLYLALYLEARLTWRGARALRPFLQFLLLLSALYVGLSRVSDNKHHCSDVLTGFVVGAVNAVFVVTQMSNLFKKKKKELRYVGGIEMGLVANCKQPALVLSP
uniref:phospholipid phosphatase 3-like n=1 Tax=Myxine glutinosa TaxID=7769 RepID=UPI00358FD7CC